MDRRRISTRLGIGIGIGIGIDIDIDIDIDILPDSTIISSIHEGITDRQTSKIRITP